MVMGARIVTNTGIPRMPIDESYLTLSQWLSPAYPLGSFSYSHGLENAIHSGWVSTPEDLRNWLTTILEEGSGRADAIWLRLGAEATDEQGCRRVDAQCRAFAATRERITESERQGRAFAQTTCEVWNLSLPAMMLPVAVGRAATLQGVDVDACVALYLQSFTANLVAAAQRLMPLGQTEGARIVAQLAPVYTRLTAETSGACAEDVFSNALLCDIASMRHETQEPRLFQT